MYIYTSFCSCIPAVLKVSMQAVLQSRLQSHRAENEQGLVGIKMYTLCTMMCSAQSLHFSVFKTV